METKREVTGRDIKKLTNKESNNKSDMEIIG
jgi:hypothetical protein